MLVVYIQYFNKPAQSVQRLCVDDVTYLECHCDPITKIDRSDKKIFHPPDECHFVYDTFSVPLTAYIMQWNEPSCHRGPIGESANAGCKKKKKRSKVCCGRKSSTCLVLLLYVVAFPVSPINRKEPQWLFLNWLQTHILNNTISWRYIWRLKVKLI